MAEIEHFCDPNDKDHPKFASVGDYKLTLYSACNQMDGKPAEIVSIGDAVKSVNIYQPSSLEIYIGANGCMSILALRESFIF